jgi:hypothetical protein
MERTLYYLGNSKLRLRTVLVGIQVLAKRAVEDKALPHWALSQAERHGGGQNQCGSRGGAREMLRGYRVVEPGMNVDVLLRVLRYLCIPGSLKCDVAFDMHTFFSMPSRLPLSLSCPLVLHAIYLFRGPRVLCIHPQDAQELGFITKAMLPPAPGRIYQLRNGGFWTLSRCEL